MVEGIDYMVYGHRSPEIDTFRLFFNDQNTIVPGYSYKNDAEYNKNLSDLLEFEVDGVKNYDNVVNMFPGEERTSSFINSIKARDVSVIDKLYIGTKLFLPISKVSISVASIIGSQFQTDFYDFNTFFVDKQVKLQQDPLYVRNESLTDGKQVLTNIHNYLSVWVIKKANPNTISDKNLQPELIDITSSVISITTSVNSNGGNFSIQLSPNIVGENDIASFSTPQSIMEDPESEVYRKISENDIIFIRYESLIKEGNRSFQDNYIAESDIPNKIYDMIGLVDAVSENISYPTGINITIKGRDLIKLLIDDENYFFPLLFAGSLDASFNNQIKSERMIKRIYTSGQYENTFVYSLRSVEKTMLFIFSQLANLGVIPDGYDPFSSYINERGEDRRSQIVDVTEDKVVSKNVANGLWQIMKLQIDDSVKGRYLADPSISRPDGSILAQIKKICQEPFVEFLSDTYGDMYYMIARKPPFDRKSVKEYIDTPNLILEINESDVIQTDFSFDQRVYTWFQIKPEGAFIGGEKLALAYIPTLYFQEFADIWGSRKMDIVSNYLSYKSFFGEKGQENYGAIKKAVVKDLIFVVESNIYLPFTRIGSIVLNGDRRIKRGGWVRFNPTGEIFYVDSVTNSASVSESSVDRSTSIQVSRGMVEQHWEKYFNIIKFDALEKALVKQVTNTQTSGTSEQFLGTDQTSQVGLDREVFNFFLNHKQFKR